MTRSLAQSLAGHTPLEWAIDWLGAARFPRTPENVRLVISWEFAESGGGGGMYNPLNTTQGGYAGETDLNSVGVKNYVRWEDGIAANAKVIHNGFYPHVVAEFLLGDDASATAAEIEASPWGTRHLPLLGPPSGPIPSPVLVPEVLTMPTIIGNGRGGYWIVKSDGAVFTFGGAAYYGGTNNDATGHPVITGAWPTPTGKGYWLVSATGAVYSFGDAKYHGGL